MVAGMEVALFIPCYVDQLYPRVGLATAAVLERYGATVRFPEAQTCCGQPMANSGFFDDARPLARKMIEVFADFEYVVCPSGSCTSMVRNHFAELLPDGPRLQSLRSRTRELCEFLHDVLRVKPAGRFPHKVGLHESCHGLRELRLGSGSERAVPRFSKTRALLEGLQGIELVEPSRPTRCRSGRSCARWLQGSRRTPSRAWPITSSSSRRTRWPRELSSIGHAMRTSTTASFTRCSKRAP